MAVPTDIASFRRIQFTPDLLPERRHRHQRVRPRHRHASCSGAGPIFAHVVLADEINRTSPKVQSAMLEAMAEKQVTVDNTHPPARRAVLRDRHAEPARSRRHLSAARARSSIASCSRSG